MDSKLRCVFEMPNENDKLVSRKMLENLKLLTISQSCLKLIFLFVSTFAGCIIMAILLCKTQWLSFFKKLVILFLLYNMFVQEEKYF